MKNSTFKTIIICVLLFVLPCISHAQGRTVKGVVTTFDSIPLINAEVKVLSSKEIILTDSIGRFEIKCEPDDKIKVSAHGFIQRKVKLNEKTKIVFVDLNFKSSENSQEIAVGYGHIKDKDKLFSVSSLRNDDVRFSDYSNLYQLIQGRFPGVDVVNKEIIVRGRNSLNYSSAALIVVDGVVEDPRILETLSPINVKSIDVLKDGSTSIYGSRGASGVVLITTKKGGE